MLAQYQLKLARKQIFIQLYSIRTIRIYKTCKGGVTNVTSISAGVNESFRLYEKIVPNQSVYIVQSKAE